MAVSYPHIYLHVPFCGRRCSYCDFAIAVRKTVPVDRYVENVLLELAARGVEFSTELRTIYFGGGTPSKLGGAGIASLLHGIREFSDVDKFSTKVREVTVEANPEDISVHAVRSWQAAGVNRVSLGVQSFDPGVLSWMHRGHTSEEAAVAVQTIREGGIDEVSLDLIFAIPDQVGASRLAADLDRAVALEPTHLSVYGLTVEPRTPLGRWTARGAVEEATEERYAAEFLLAHERLVAAGFEHYEVSSYARPGHRAIHNAAYWSGAPYLGLGPSAHGFDGRVRRWNTSAYAEWSTQVEQGIDPLAGEETIGPDERLAEAVYLGLRTSDGLVLRPEDATIIGPWIDAGWGRQEGDRLVLTPDGWLRIDALAAALTSVRSHS
ncbi:MAG: radical SAM family heme chaperone HemW [Gemmatimonadetes bacterium]|nr:radical SAM family heme chaperone HemW [Gemmatimonadota bacterium]